MKKNQDFSEKIIEKSRWMVEGRESRNSVYFYVKVVEVLQGIRVRWLRFKKEEF